MCIDDWSVASESWRMQPAAAA